MKCLISFSILALTLGFCKTLPNAYPYYKINEVYINTLVPDSNGGLRLTSGGLKNESYVFLDLSFDINFCDSAQEKLQYGWMPSFGYNGIVEKIKSVDIFLFNTETGASSAIKVDTLTGKFDYEVLKGNRKVNVPGIANNKCFQNISDLISSVNSYRNFCTNLYSMRTNSLLLKFNTSENEINKYDRIDVHVKFMTYTIKAHSPI
jgi:hypothetical protein